MYVQFEELTFILDITSLILYNLSKTELRRGNRVYVKEIRCVRLIKGTMPLIKLCYLVKISLRY